MSNLTNVKAGRLEPSTLAHIPVQSLCADFIDGFCRRADRCQKSHEICVVPVETASAPVLNSQTNYLSLDLKSTLSNKHLFDDDGPGGLSKHGPRHDNDHVEIKDISILPTTDEILSKRLPYMPKKDPFTDHRHYCGQDRLLDTHFRHLRYENTQPIIDACYHASQQLFRSVPEARALDYEYGMVTPKGFRYSLFRDVGFEEVSFDSFKGVTLRLSFACPKALRGDRLGMSKHLEDGMLVALVGLDDNNCLSTTFMEVYLRQSTNAMRPRTGNDLRASARLTFAEPSNVDAVRRLLYNAQGLLRERFVLVDLPSTLYAGFHWTLKQLQNQSQGGERLAFLDSIAPWVAGASPEVSPPKYTTAEGFAYQLDVLRQKGTFKGKESLVLKPSALLASKQVKADFIDTLCCETTLDRGQAVALCENLCRGLAFTQGPPGAGKTFLGVALAKVLLASRAKDSKKPILVVCMTNHALDSYLGDLRDSGVKNLARLGGQSKEHWTKEHSLAVLGRTLKRTTFEGSSLMQCHNQIECLTTEGTSWCGSLNAQALSWPAVRDLLKHKCPAMLNQFAGLEKVSESALSDIRLARKAGGFAFEFWCMGGDIKDIDKLLEKFNSMLGDKAESTNGADDPNFHSRQRVVNTIISNADAAAHHNNTDVDLWRLSLIQRQDLLEQWKAEIDARTILDRTVEIHRRHQAAMSRKLQVRQSIDARCLGQQDVIGMTTTACAMNWPTLSQIGLKIVICEEAAEVKEVQSLCTLFPTVEHAISIGDPLQLRAQVNEPALSVETEVGANYRLDESLMERLMFPSTKGTLPIAFSQLTIQRRMHTELANIMRLQLYPYLQDHESTLNRAPVPVMADRMWWLDHQMPEDARDTKSAMANSFSNSFEVEMVAGLVEHLVNSNEYSFKDITILTPYNGQLAALTARFSGRCSLWLSEKDREALKNQGLLDPEEAPSAGKTDIQISSMLKLATIDNFQGEESRVVILSTVRSNTDGRVGFLKTPNRINVACSRAKNGFYILGNASQMRKVKMWGQIIDHLTTKGQIGREFRTCCPRHPQEIYSVGSPEQWRQISQCQVMCETELPCGHACNMKCHPPALHGRATCNSTCLKTHKECGHPCTNRCGEECGECSFLLQDVTLACGHKATQTCEAARNTEPVPCDITISSVKLPCGHSQEIRCSNKDQTPKCTEKCGSVLKCGHHCEGSCHTCSTIPHHAQCTSICSKELPCGHRCAASCHNGQCPPCSLPCEKSCQHGSCSQACSKACDPCLRICDWSCAHTNACKTACCLPCGKLPCNEPCPELLPCGHRCPSLCCERCPTKCLECITGQAPTKVQMFLACGHHFDLKTLDEHVKIGKLYQVDGASHIIKANLAPGEQSSGMNLSCPSCSQDCKDLRRYALAHQLSVLESNVDRVCAKFSQKLDTLMEQTYSTKCDLDNSFDEFAKALRPGPLTGRTNQDMVTVRGNALAEVQQNIIEFRDNVVRPFEDSITDQATFLGVPPTPAEIDMNFSYRLHFDALFYRCRLIVLEEALRMIPALRAIQGTSQHTFIMAEKLKDLTITEAKELSVATNTAISACEAKHLKRLEAEFRLIQMCFHVVLKNLGSQSQLNVATSLSKIQQLCESYPDTAGAFSSIYAAVKEVVNGLRRCVNLYTKDAESIWWSWPKHTIGSFKYCEFGHPYSGETWENCPECGKEVIVEEVVIKEVQKAKPVNPNDFLKENEFIIAMLALTTSSKSWRA